MFTPCGYETDLNWGFYDNPFQFFITFSIAGGTIRYTTDGPAPEPLD
jgi:hypothetical protein